MKIAYNPKTAAALTTAPANDDITFDLSGLSIYVKGVRFKGTDTTYSVFKKHDSSGGGYDGLVPVPNYNNDSKNRYLREDGTWTNDYVTLTTILYITGKKTISSLMDITNGDVNDDNSLYVRPVIYMDDSKNMIYSDTKANTIIRGSSIKFQLSNENDSLLLDTNSLKSPLPIISTLSITGTTLVSTTTDAAPLTVSSNILVSKLNADLLDGKHNGEVTAAYLQHKRLDSTTINNTAGTFAFSGSEDPWPRTDWVGLQIGDNNDKFQISVQEQHLILRQNDSTGGNTSSWNAWRSLAFITDNVASATKLQTARAIWGLPFDGTANVDGCIRIQANEGNYCEGIRIKPYNSWTTILLGGDDLTSNTGTSVNTWSIHNNNGNFYINKNSARDSTGNELCNVGGNWGIGTVSPSHKLHVRGNAYIALGLTSDGDINTNARFQSNGSNSRGSYPNIRFHIPGINWAQILMNGSGQVEFRGGAALDSSCIPVIAGAFVKDGSSDNYVLLGGGGHKSISSFLDTYDGRYVNVTGDTMTGPLTIDYNRSGGGVKSSLLNVLFNGTHDYGIVAKFHSYGRDSPAIRFSHSTNKSEYNSLVNTNWSVGMRASTTTDFAITQDRGTNGWGTVRFAINNSGNVGIGVDSAAYKLHVAGDIYTTTGIISKWAFINTGDSTLKVYDGKITDVKSDGNICLQTSIDGTDGQSHSHPTQYGNRCNLVLQPRGGQVYIGTNPDGGNTAYKLYVNGKAYLTGGTINGRLLVNYNVGHSTPAIAINYYDSYTINDTSIAQIKMGTPTYNAFLGLSPASKSKFGKVGYFMHIGSNYEFLWATSNWMKLMALECSTGNLWVNGTVTAASFMGNASSATNATNIYVHQHTSNNVEYPLVWSNLSNANTVLGNLLYKSYSHLTYNPSSRRIIAGLFYANNASGPHFTGVSTSGNWAYLRLNNSTCYWDISTKNNSGSGGLWLARYNGSDNGIFVSTGSLVGIGTSSPSQKLHVDGNILATGIMTAAHFYESSDILLKENISSILGTDNIPILRKFNWKKDGKVGYGFIALELEELGYYELVNGNEDGTKTVHYTAALSLVVAKLQNKIKELEKKIEILKCKN